MNKQDRDGICFIVSAPSGSGKSTLIQRVLAEVGGLEFITSTTTRAPRLGETAGRDYHFVDDAEFDRLIQAKAFLEWATVHEKRYGTPKADFSRKIAQGIDVILEIDIQGAQQIRQNLGNHGVVSIFILPQSPDILESRLHSRGKDSKAVIELRLATAQHEVLDLPNYQYLVLNQELERATQELKSIIVAERCRLEYREQLVEQWLKAVQVWPSKAD